MNSAQLKISKPMKVEKNVSVIVTEGDLQIHMGKALTRLLYKGQEKMVFRAEEIDVVINMLQTAKKELA